MSVAAAGRSSLLCRGLYYQNKSKMQRNETAISDRVSANLLKTPMARSRWRSILFCLPVKVIIGSYQATKAIAKKAQKKFWGFKGIGTHDLRDTVLGVGQEWVQFIPVIWREWNDVYMV